MAEFQEIGRQWARMCKSFRLLPNGCSGCPLVDEHCYHESPFALDFDRIEYAVMQWAAEHPEPMYPTWAEWLLKVGAARRVPVGEPWPVEFPDGSMLEPCCETVVKENEHIPADIAQKLGIEPKEG